ncbi:cupin domain-containing protein [Dinoroseobacter sp. S124A]|uniref:cupin domain-containing protein n=1 Tax=Dinoroseobacter sp. S124A TaxID=3415128 RepID=UPI003C7979B3
MSDDTASKPKAALATEIPARAAKSGYPAPFAARVAGRVKRQLGNAFGLTNFGVNLTDLAPGAESALLHRHKTQDEFIYILSGHPTLKTDQGEIRLAPGMCAGFPAGGVAHHLVNETATPVRYLEIGDRSPGDSGTYPDDDLEAHLVQGTYIFTRKNGTPFED